MSRDVCPVRFSLVSVYASRLWTLQKRAAHEGPVGRVALVSLSGDLLSAVSWWPGGDEARMAARRPLGALTNQQQTAAPQPQKPQAAAPRPAVYRCDHCFSFTGSYAAVAAHEATCPCAAPSIKREAAPPPPAAPAPKRRVPLWVLVCFLWAGYEAARPLPQPVCPARPRPFDEILIEQLADVAASESTALVVHEEVGYGVAGKLGNAFLKALFAPVRVLLAPFRMMFRRR